MFVGYWEIYGFAIVKIHEHIVITSKAVVVILEHRFRLCEMVVLVGMRVLIGIDFLSTDTPPSDNVVGN